MFHSFSAPLFLAKNDQGLGFRPAAFTELRSGELQRVVWTLRKRFVHRCCNLGIRIRLGGGAPVIQQFYDGVEIKGGKGAIQGLIQFSFQATCLVRREETIPGLNAGEALGGERNNGLTIGKKEDARTNPNRNAREQQASSSR